MKTPRLFHLSAFQFPPSAFPILLLAALLAAHSAQAGTYNWNITTTPASWSLAANWTGSPPAGGPSAAGDVDTIGTNITGNAIVNLFNTGDSGTAAKTVGILNIGDTDNTNTFTIAAGTGGGSLVLNNSGSGAQINELSTAKGDTISAGVQISDAGGLTVSNASGNAFTMSGAITSSGSNMNVVFDANGAGALTISGTSVNNQGTITNNGTGGGGTTITAVGTNVTGITQSSATSTFTVTTLNVNRSGTTATAGSTTTTGHVLSLGTVQGSGNLSLVNNSTASGNTINLTTLSLTTGTVTNTGTGASAITNISGNIGSGVGLITQNSSGTLSLAGTNTNTAGVSLQSGTLSLGSTTALGDTASTLTITGGNLDSSVTTLVLANNNAQNWNGSFGFLGTKALNLGTGSVTIGVANPTVTTSGGTSNPLTVGGAITDSGNGLTKAGAGALALTGNSAGTYTGTTTINAGTLTFSNNSLGNTTGSITFGGPGTLQWAAGNTQDISNKGLSSTGFTGTLDLLANNVTFATANGLTGSGNFTKLATGSAGILTLSAANDLSGTYTAATTGGATLLKNTNALQNATVSLLTGITTGGVLFDSSVGTHAFTFGNLTGAGNLALQDNAGTPNADADRRKHLHWRCYPQCRHAEYQHNGRGRHQRTSRQRRHTHDQWRHD